MNPKTSSPDIFGKAVESYFLRKDKTPIIVHSKDFYDDEIPVDYLFRNFEDMPPIEQKALDLVEGKTLDVGCCAGSHSLVLQDRGISVTSIDISKKCIQVCRARGLKQAKHIDFFELETTKFDTMIFLMNGIGIAKTIDGLTPFFEQIKRILYPGGQVLLDSSDLIFLYENEIQDIDSYYGEVEYSMSYKQETSNPFSWLYLDFEMLKNESIRHGFQCELVYADNHYGFLARLTWS